MAELEFESEKQDLAMRVSETYIKVLESMDNLEFTIAEEESLKLHYKLAKERYANGLAPITDFHDAKARLNFTTAQRITAEYAMADAFEALNEITGKKIENLAGLQLSGISMDEQLDVSTDESDNDPARMTGKEYIPLRDPDPDDIDKWLDVALEQNTGILIRKQEVSVAKKEIERQRGGHMPNLVFVGRLNRDDEGGSLFGGESDLSTREAILQLNVPIFQGFSVHSKVNEARKLYEASKQDLEKEIRMVDRATRSAFLGVKSAIENSMALRQSLISSQITLEAKRESFKAGLLPSLGVIDAERDFHQARQEYAKSQYDYILNSLQLKKEVGTLIEDDINELNQWFK